jgi:competence protein ComEC
VRVVPFSRQRFPFAGILLSAISGILFCSCVGVSVWLLAGFLLVCPILLLMCRRGGVCFAVTFGCFILLHLWNWTLSPARKLAEVLDGNRDGVVVRGVVLGDPRISHSGSVSFPMRISELRDQEDGKIITDAPLMVQVRWYGKIPVYGDLVTFQGVPDRPSDPRNPGEMNYRRWLERHAIYTRISVDPAMPGSIQSGGHGNLLMAFAIRSRHRMEEILSTDLDGASEVRGVIEGICLGVTEHAPEGFTDDFRFTGTMHLFAVSGLHVGMLAVILWFVLKAFRVPRIWAVLVTIPALFFYVLVTGMKMGSIRSATMAAILLAGLAICRRSPLINTLAAAAFFQLCVDTNDLFSAGWQFSYSVVFAIILISPRLEDMLCRWHSPDPFLPPRLISSTERVGFRMWHHVAGLSAVSASAWIGSLIPTIAYFHLISLSALGANLLSVPLAFIVLSLGVVSLACGIFSSWLAGAFNNANWLVTKLLLCVVHASALIPGGHWFIDPFQPRYPKMTILDLHGGSCTLIRDGSDFSLIDCGRKRDAFSTILPCLESMGANSIHACVITKPDASHLGGLRIIGKEFSIDQLLIAPRSVRSKPVEGVLHGLNPKQLLVGQRNSLTRHASVQLLSSPGDDHILAITLGDRRVLLLPKGDADFIRSLSGMPAQQLRADLLVVPLGGAEFRSMLDLVTRVSPGVLVCPVDPFKRNGAPSGEWERLLAAKGVSLLRQDQSGAVTITSLPGKFNPMEVTSFLKTKSSRGFP